VSNKIIIFPQDSGVVAVMMPTGELGTMETATKDVPTGKPFVITDASDIPQGIPQEAWTVDFSEPDGYGQGGA